MTWFQKQTRRLLCLSVMTGGKRKYCMKDKTGKRAKTCFKHTVDSISRYFLNVKRIFGFFWGKRKKTIKNCLPFCTS